MLAACDLSVGIGGKGVCDAFSLLAVWEIFREQKNFASVDTL